MKQLFQNLVDQHQRLIYSQAMFILSDRGEAEDATQEAFIRLWSKLSQPGGEELSSQSAKAWLLRVVKNLCIDKLRRRKPIADTNLDELENQTTWSGPAAQLMTKQLSDWLNRAIERLKEPYRSLIILADLNQQPIKQVAQSLDLNENQAKVYIHRGRKQLRGYLQGMEL